MILQENTPFISPWLYVFWLTLSTSLFLLSGSLIYDRIIKLFFFLFLFLFRLCVFQRYHDDCERLQQEYQVAMQQYQASKSESSETHSTLQLLLKSSPVKPRGAGPSGKTETKQAASPTSPMDVTTLVSPTVASKTEQTSPSKTEPALSTSSSSQADATALPLVNNMERSPLVNLF